MFFVVLGAIPLLIQALLRAPMPFRTANRICSSEEPQFEPIIAPLSKLPGMLTSNKKQSFQSALDYNWVAGMCEHKQVFEATQTIARLMFNGDLVAFAMSDGKVSLVRISTGQVLDKYNAHKTEVTALYFDGVNLLTGGGDGLLNVYNVTYNTPRKLGNCLKQYNLHDGNNHS